MAHHHEPKSDAAPPEPLPAGARQEPPPRDTSSLHAPENPPGVGNGPITITNPTGSNPTSEVDCGTDAAAKADEEGHAVLVAGPEATPHEDE